MTEIVKVPFHGTLIHTTLIDSEPHVVRYQTESARVLREYWSQSLPARGQVMAGDFFEPHTLTWEETTALIRQRYGIALTVNELTRMLRTAGVLKQTGAPRKQYEHLFWFTGAAWNVHPHVLPQVAQKAYDIGRELQDFRFIQARLQLEGVGQPPSAGVVARGGVS